jgi:hypothetical protein
MSAFNSNADSVAQSMHGNGMGSARKHAKPASGNNHRGEEDPYAGMQNEGEGVEMQDFYQAEQANPLHVPRDGRAPSLA